MAAGVVPFCAMAAACDELPDRMLALTFQGVEKVSRRRWHRRLHGCRLHMRTLPCSAAQVELSEVPRPRIVHPTDVVVRVTLCSICGSDLHPFHGRERGVAQGTVVGHEFVGEVVELGSRVAKLRISDHVMSPFTACCGGCFYCKKAITCRSVTVGAGAALVAGLAWVNPGRRLHA